MAVASAPAETAQAEAAPRRLKMTYEEYLAWAGEDNILAEWVDGEVIVHMPPKPLHQRVAVFLTKLLGSFVDLFDLGEVFTAAMEMKLPEGPAREPDVLFVSKAHAARVIDDRLDGPADLAIEIVSDDSVTRDREDKFYEYERAGIPEYWVIDPRPNRLRAYFYQLNAQGRYQPVIVGADGVYRSEVLPGFWLKVDWLWAEQRPDPLLALTEIVGPEKVAEHIKGAAK